MSRVKARLKFMVDDVGADGIRERVEAKVGRALERHELQPLESQPDAHLGVHPQKDGCAYIGVSVPLGLSRGEQLIGVADVADSFGGDIRLARQQNLIVTGVVDVDATVAQLDELGLPLTTNAVWGNSIACTGEPHCNFSVGETKDRLRGLLEYLEATFGEAIAELRLHLDGCPHACAQHWVGDLGFQATTGKDPDGNRIPAYDIFVRGGLGPGAQIGTALFRRVDDAALDGAVTGLIRGWIEHRADGEPFTDFQRRLADDELAALAGLEPARKRVSA
jgi:ferredoxin-nitrite reductase